MRLRCQRYRIECQRTRRRSIPTDNDIEGVIAGRRCQRTGGGRAEAFEDILWALINSTEYQTKR